MRCVVTPYARSTPGRCSTPSTELGEGPYVQLWPHRHGTDAMFAAALQVTMSAMREVPADRLTAMADR